MGKIIASAALLSVFALPVYAASEKTGDAGTALDTANIEKLTGIKGTFDEKEQVYKVSAPRKDLHGPPETLGCVQPYCGIGCSFWRRQVSFRLLRYRRSFFGPSRASNGHSMSEQESRPLVRL